MIFNTLHESSQRGELMLVDNGMCHWHLRRDGQLTIREIISTRRGAGSQILNRLKLIPGATSLFAKCPVELPSNEWYRKRGFILEQTENGLNHWRLNVALFQHQPNARNFEVIYCADGNQRLMEIAIDAGLLTGARLPGTIHYRPYFADQDFKKPDRACYMTELAKHRPYMSTVLDWNENTSQSDVLSWADETSQFVEVVVIVPKRWQTIHLLPREINGKQVRLGYSVPTSYGGTNVPLVEFQGWPVHLLGGSPEKQLALTQSLDVLSADTNYTQKIATKYCQYWTPGDALKAKNRYWPALRESDGDWLSDAPYEAFRRSCHNVMQAWRNLNTLRCNEFQLPLVFEGANS